MPSFKKNVTDAPLKDVFSHINSVRRFLGPLTKSVGIYNKLKVFHKIGRKKWFQTPQNH